ncbi:formylglycine-generating enzyme family protein [Roseomonas sp. CCTCC AB2023176]|uniref:formylglycine-generating enzyme family protein n=1 Tax=Roseomonas sp. CCTCC AB2023176 TaxID=3342640 RepID=UPI0035E2BBF9
MTRATPAAFRDGDGLPELVVIPPGRFLMGSPDEEAGHEDSEYPVREVILARPFALGRFPVTFAEFDHFIAATRAPAPSDEGWGRGDRPAVNVTWHEARDYAAWLAAWTGRAYRLPTEAEWEYAARAGATTAYPWGADLRPGDARYLVEEEPSEQAGTVPVGCFPPNAFGLHDVIGNVWEWVEDCWNEFYVGAPLDGSAWLTGDCGRRVLRGGSWRDVPRQVRAAARNRNAPDFRCDDYGFRIAREV